VNPSPYQGVEARSMPSLGTHIANNPNAPKGQAAASPTEDEMAFV
jgi:hypothetical protein